MSDIRKGELLRQQTTLVRFGELALRSDNLDDILTEGCRLVGQALGTDLAKVMELQQDGDTLLVRAGIGWKPGVVGEVTIKATEDTSEGHALKTGEPMISSNIETETRFRYPAFLIENGVRAVVNVLIIGGQGKPPFGILQVDSRDPREFTENDTTFLRSYANLLAAAVDRLRIVADLRSREARLRESIDRQEAALGTGLIGFFDWDVPKGTITADKCFAGFYGIEPGAATAGVSLGIFFGLIHPDDRAGVEADVTRAISSLSEYTQEFRLVRATGEVRWVQVRGHCYEHRGGRPFRYTGTAVDITSSKAAEEALRRNNELLEVRVAERTGDLTEANNALRAEAEERARVEEALRQAHKMEAVGQLTGGLAHDFNNLLTAISGSVELMRTRVGQGRTADLGRYIDTVMAAVSRAAALIHRLLAFSRRQTLDPKPTNLTRLAAGMEDLFRRTVGPAIDMQTKLADEPWPTLCDANQLENALLNLVINARDAMPDGGRLLIETSNIAFGKWSSAPGASPPPDLPPGEYVLMSVTDTGTGMAPSVVARAFDPFFTTKPLGQGTGLGLSMVYGFVQQSGGHIRLRSTEGQGTEVSIYLPRHFGIIDGETRTNAAMPPRLTPANAVVLLVEDEPALRMIVRDGLSDAGYTVLEADNGRSGLTIMESGVRIDLLLSDVGLPGGMNGRQLADVARQQRPGIKVLFITGYAEASAAGRGLLGDGMQVMTKPFQVDALAARVQGMISS